jgi:hypothetical protein
MVTVAWNPSTLKLYTGATDKMCASCCGTGTVSCPSTYTISIKGTTPCPAMSPAPFVAVSGLAQVGQWVSYNGVAYRCISTHQTDQWYPACWAPGLNWSFPSSNVTFVLYKSYADISGTHCAYGYSNDPIDPDISVTLVLENNKWILRVSVKHILYPSYYDYPYLEGGIGFWGFHGESYSDGWCETIHEAFVPIDPGCVRLEDHYYYSTLAGICISRGGTAKIFPGSFPGWTVNTGYQVGNIVCHLAEKYTCTQNHYSTIANEPGVGSQWLSYWSVSTVC